MKKSIVNRAFILIFGIVIAGCDVTNNSSESDGSSGANQDADPVVVDFPIAYIERPVPMGFADDDDIQMSLLPDEVLDPTQFRPGARLLIKARASVSAPARVITDGVFEPTASATPEATSETTPTPSPSLYDVRDLSINSEGTKLLFSMRAPEIEGADDDEQPKWDIWEYVLETDRLTRIIESNILADQGHDRFPVYLPDDSIVFSSTRQRTSKSLLLDQSRPQFAYVTELDDESRAFTLHRIDEAREEIEQISFGKGHDLYPTVLDDGRILFLRGDDTSGANRDRLSFYTINPDGSNLSLEYGFHSPSGTVGRNDAMPRGALTNPLEMPDGRILVNFKPRESSRLGGDIYAVDTENYYDLTVPISASVGGSGPAETSLSFGDVVLEDKSPHGFFNSAYPLFDGTDRLLVSWMPCLVQGYRLGIYVNRVDTEILDDEDAIIDIVTTYQLINADGILIDRNGNPLAADAEAVEIEEDELVSLPCASDTFDNENILLADPQFGVWIYDPQTETQDPVVLANTLGIMYTEAVVFEPRVAPDFIPRSGQDDELGQELIEENVGLIHIRSIYDFDGADATAQGIAAMADPLQTAPDSRPVRFVRFYEEANMPHEDDYEIDGNLVSGRFNNPSRGIIGYAEVHPDGSVMTKLPANVQFSMEFVDAKGRRVTDGGLGIRHRNWLNLRPGEVRECNGCHTPTSTVPHGRAGAGPEMLNLGALAEAPFPNTQLLDRFGTPFAPPQIGETMAEYYVRIKRAEDEEGVDPLAPSLDIVYTDVWTDPNSGATPGTDITLEFGVLDPVTETSGPDNLKTQAPVLIGACLETWSNLCRTVIDYPDHIQPIFEVTRSISIEGVDTDTNCLACHSPLDAAGDAQVPAPDIDGFQLDFSPIISNLDQDMVLLKGYDELFAQDDPLFDIDPDTGTLTPRLTELVIDGEIQYQMVQQQDPDTGALLFEFLDINGATVCLPLDTTDADVIAVTDENEANVPCMEFVLDEFGQRIALLVPDLQDRYLNANGANNNNNLRFFRTFETGGAHEGYLTPAEIKLFSEWLDGGSQYYNEIFKALED